MGPVSSASVAVQILRQSPVARGTPSNDAFGRVTIASTSPRTAEDLFSVNSSSVTRLKINLYKQVGDALGVKEADYDSFRDYGAALSQAVSQLKLDPNAQQIISSIESELGLTKLGVSLDTVINAIIDPAGAESDKLDTALARQVGMDDDKLYGRI